MNTVNCSRNVTKVDPHTLSDGEFQELYEVTQDMWAYGLGELIQCNKCGEIQGKQEIFGSLSKEIYENTVASIMRILDIKEIPCSCCGGETRLIYGSSHIDNLKSKLLGSEYVHLNIAKSDDGMIVGNCSYYVSSFEKVYDFELQDHYSLVGANLIKRRISDILGYIPQKIIAFSSIGFIEKYRNSFHLFEFLRSASETLGELGESMPGIMELDRYNPIYRVFTRSGGVSLEIKNRVDSKLINNTSKNYDSDLVIFPNPLQAFRENFSSGPRAFLRKLVTS